MGTRRRIIKTELDRESRVTWRVAKVLAADGDICCGVIEAPRVDGFKSRNMPSGSNYLLLTGSSQLVLVAIALSGFTVSCTVRFSTEDNWKEERKFGKPFMMRRETFHKEHILYKLKLSKIRL